MSHWRLLLYLGHLRRQVVQYARLGNGEKAREAVWDPKFRLGRCRLPTSWQFRCRYWARLPFLLKLTPARKDQRGMHRVRAGTNHHICLVCRFPFLSILSATRLIFVSHIRCHNASTSCNLHSPIISSERKNFLSLNRLDTRRKLSHNLRSYLDIPLHFCLWDMHNPFSTANKQTALLPP